MKKSVGETRMRKVTSNISKQQLLFFWVLILFLSELPRILVIELFQGNTGWILWAKLGVLIAGFLLSLVVDFVKPFRNVFLVFFALYTFSEIFYQISQTSVWQNMFAFLGEGFPSEMMSIQMVRVAVAILMILFLLVMGYSRKEFFFVKGQLDVPAEGVKWLGIDAGTRWNKLGPILALAISSGTLLFLVLAGRPSISILGQALPMLPLVLFFSATNAFAEEMNYRAALMAPIFPIVGKHQTMLMMAVLFGFGHFYGVPYGVVGVVMAGALGWMLSKSMLETKGFFWPWFIHFWQDVLIFSFMAIGSITPGG
jgi:hypothetical protein